MERFISLFGLFAMIGFAWLLSSHKSKVSLRIVIGGVLLQFGLAALILKTTPGKRLFVEAGAFFTQILNSVDAGAEMVFGPKFHEFYFAFKVLPTIIFFSSLMAILYHLGIVQRVVQVFAVLMQWTFRTSGAESLSAAANIFVGQTEAPLVIRPYVGSMTQSELMAVMVGGFATIAGGVLAAFVGMGIDAGHLMTASVISAPAALLLAKVMLPETEEPKTMGNVQIHVDKTGVNVVDAAANGAAQGLLLALNVAAMLIAFLALIALANACLGWIGVKFGFTGANEWSLALILGYVFWPFAWLMGIESNDCFHAAQLLGLKMAATEFVAYQQLGEWIKPESTVHLSDRTVQLLTYALCGFANFGSIGIQLGGIGGIAPERRSDLARLGLRAMLGGTLAAFMTACVAGVLI